MLRISIWGGLELCLGGLSPKSHPCRRDWIGTGFGPRAVLWRFLFIQNYLICSKLEQRSSFSHRDAISFVHISQSLPLNQKKKVSLDAQVVWIHNTHPANLDKPGNSFLFLLQNLNTFNPPTAFTSLFSHMLLEKSVCKYSSTSRILGNFLLYLNFKKIWSKVSLWSNFWNCYNCGLWSVPNEKPDETEWKSHNKCVVAKSKIRL